MSSIFLQDRLLRQFNEFQQLNARGYTIEANLYINAVIRELAELRSAQCYFERIVESYEVDVSIIEKIINMIVESLTPIIQISDLLAMECEAVYLFFAANSIKNNASLTEIKQQLTAMKDLRVNLLTTNHQDSDIGETQWNDIVYKTKHGHRHLH